MEHEEYDNMSLSDLRFQIVMLEVDGKTRDAERAKEIYKRKHAEAEPERLAKYNEIKFQTRLARIFATLIDCIILTAAYWIIVLAAYLANYDASIINALVYIGPFAYSTLLHYLYGQTLGKMIFNVQVLTNHDESSLSLIACILRDAPLLVTSVLLYFSPFLIDAALKFAILIVLAFTWHITNFIAFMSSNKRRAIHDYIAGTVVVYLPRNIYLNDKYA